MLRLLLVCVALAGSIVGFGVTVASSSDEKGEAVKQLIADYAIDWPTVNTAGRNRVLGIY
jgi:hypothetical protein